MSCILRVIGEHLALDECLAQLKRVPYRQWRKGEPRFPVPNSRINVNSGFTLVLSESDGDFVPMQIEDAEIYLRAYKDTLKPLIARPDVDEAYIDFAWWFPVGKRGAHLQYNFFPPTLLSVCGELGLSIVVSVYADKPRKLRR
jgi:hypothetical protein